MLLASLCVAHVFKKLNPNSAELAAARNRDVFKLETCQRLIWVFESGESPATEEGVEFFQGADAYEFLLRVATGLESEVRGETDVFGQLKEGWQLFDDLGSPAAEALGPWVQKIFEDAKEVRATCLQNAGGDSYGSLVRRLMRRYVAAGSPAEPILIVGAGHIARAVSPWLIENELWVWNRSPRALAALGRELGGREKARIRLLSTEAEERRAWREAAHAVICIPLDQEEDARRIALWKEGFAGTPPGVSRSIVHLGGNRDQCGDWNELPNFHPLDDLFALQKSQSAARSASIDRALKACREKSRLRALPGSPTGSLTLPHGWEDLAGFG